MKKIMEGIENEKNITKDGDVTENELDQMKNSSLDELENAPEDMAELFAEPPLLDFDSEPTDEDLKLEEMDIDNIEEDLNFDMISLDDPVKVYLREIGRVPLLSSDEEKGSKSTDAFLERYARSPESMRMAHFVLPIGQRTSLTARMAFGIPEPKTLYVSTRRVGLFG